MKLLKTYLKPFAALVLARCGAKPIVLERGQDAVTRQRDVASFWRTGVLDPESNVQFGEGGAGAFSDGKLNTGTRDIRHRWILEQLAACGALVTEPMTYSRFYAAVVTAMDLPVGHPARGLHLERYIRPYLEYLVDRGDLTLIEQNGAPAVAPKEARHGR